MLQVKSRAEQVDISGRERIRAAGWSRIGQGGTAGALRRRLGTHGSTAMIGGIRQNLLAASVSTNLDRVDQRVQATMARLSSGRRVQTAADDPAGFVIASYLAAQAGGLGVATQNGQNAMSVLQTAMGALNQTAQVLDRMSQLATSAANGGASDATAQAADQQEFAALQDELDRIAQTTQFGTIKLLDGSYTGEVFQLGITGSGTSAATTTTTSSTSGTTTTTTTSSTSGTTTTSTTGGTTTSGTTTGTSGHGGGSGTAPGQTKKTGGASTGTGTTSTGTTSTGTTSTGTTSGSTTTTSGGTTGATTSPAGAVNFDQITVSIAAADSNSLGVGAAMASIGDTAAAQNAITSVSAALAQVADMQSALGGAASQVQGRMASLVNEQQNLTAAASRITDANFAQEATALSEFQIIARAATSMLAQANATPQLVLRLLGQ